MNQIRDAFDDTGALSAGSRRDVLTSFSQRHGQALLPVPAQLAICCLGHSRAFDVRHHQRPFFLLVRVGHYIENLLDSRCGSLRRPCRVCHLLAACPSPLAAEEAGLPAGWASGTGRGRRRLPPGSWAPIVSSRGATSPRPFLTRLAAFETGRGPMSPLQVSMSAQCLLA